MRLIRRFGLTAFAALCRRHLHAMLAVGGEYPVEAGKVNSWLGHQGGQSGDEVQRLEDHMGGDGESTGEVVVRAPWLTEGYLKNEETSAALWRGGYLHTGDIGHLDRDGYLKVTDRLKDVIKSGGEWVSSVLLEDLVSQHPGVSEVAAIGIPDEKWGERPMLLIVRRDGADETVEAGAIAAHLRAFVDQGIINTWAVPERIEFTNAIDKTSVGKIDKKRLRQRYGQKGNEA